MRSESQEWIDYTSKYKLPTTTIKIVLLYTITDLINALISVNTGVVLPQPFDDCIPCRCGLALFYLPASSTPPSSNQSSTRATLPSINYIKTTNRDHRTALPTASITLTGVVNGWPKKNSRHRAHLTESLVRITGVTCHSIARVWLQEWVGQWGARPKGF